MLNQTDQVLEIGCGVGILIEQIAHELSSGRITAIDRSASMIVEFSKTIFKESAFDKIIAFIVNFFWKDSQR